ncbi:MAG: helix-turn-helix domain-containing protein [Patescibacteria group bacterium]
MPTPPLRLSISEAEKLFGLSSKTLRRAIKNGEVNYIVVRGRYRLNFDNLLKWSQKRPTTKNKLEHQGLGQYVEKWKINNKYYSPNPELAKLSTVKIDKKNTKK